MQGPDQKFSDRRHLQTQSYGTQDKLNVRIRTHELYTRPQVDFITWVLDRVPWQGTETVLDVGCGSGAYAAATRRRCRHYVAGDLSFGMLRDLEYPNLDRVNLDVQQLPLADGTADLVLANHMLYHVPDREAALAAIARVLRPGGTLIAATNSEESMHEMEQLPARALRRLGLSPLPEFGRVERSFSCENGRSFLSRHFPHVTRHDLATALVFPTTQPILDYINSNRDWYEAELPPHVTWDELLVAIAAHLTDHFAHHDTFRVGKLSCVFVCRTDE